MKGTVEDVVDVPVLDDLSSVHDAHLVGEPGNDAEVVRDPDQRGAALPTQPLDLEEDLRLDRDIEGCGRLVGNDQIRLVK